MSSVLKGVGKVFKSIAKIAVPILAAAAVIWTAGAALGIEAFAGGFGGAVTGALTAIGVPATSTLGTIVAGAVTYAGEGAVIGGVTTAAMGGDFKKGMYQGAAIGAVTGGISAGFGGPIDPLHPGVTMANPSGTADLQAAGAPDAIGDKVAETNLPADTGGTNNIATEANAEAAGSTSAADKAMADNVAAQMSGGGSGGNAAMQALSDKVDKLGAMPGLTTAQAYAPVVGGAISGVGAGIGGEAQAKAMLAGQQMQLDTISQNYSSAVPGLMSKTPQVAGQGLPTPVQRFATNFQYAYVPGQGVVQVPISQTS